MRTVLIADRSLTIRRVVEHALGGRAARVVGAADADELHRLARVEHPDIVLCDATLPGLVLEELRDNLARVPELSETPFVLLSSALDPLEEDDATRLGASGLILKPFEMASLAETIERALERGVVTPARPLLVEDEEQEPEESRAGIPEPPSFDSVWDEGSPDAELPPASDPGPEPEPEPEEIVLEDPDPLTLSDDEPAFSHDEDEPLGPLSPDGPVFDPNAARVPLPGDEDFRLGFSALPEDHEIGDSETVEPATAEPAMRDSSAFSPIEELERLEPELRVLVERIVREIAWEVVPDIVERVVRERSSGVLPDTSSGDRKP